MGMLSGFAAREVRPMETARRTATDKLKFIVTDPAPR